MDKVIIHPSQPLIFSKKVYNPDYNRQKRQDKANEAYMNAKAISFQKSMNENNGGGDDDEDKYKKIAKNLGVGGSIVLGSLELLSNTIDALHLEDINNDYQIKNVSNQVNSINGLNNGKPLNDADKEKIKDLTNQLYDLREMKQAINDALDHVEEEKQREIDKQKNREKIQRDNTTVAPIDIKK